MLDLYEKSAQLETGLAGRLEFLALRHEDELLRFWADLLEEPVQALGFKTTAEVFGRLRAYLDAGPPRGQALEALREACGATREEVHAVWAEVIRQGEIAPAASWAAYAVTQLQPMDSKAPLRVVTCLQAAELFSPEEVAAALEGLGGRN
ncbi:MAG: hypothetical protein RIB45_17770 [Marivibrio sp.]|uniref:hypothetical protein n=1 Tax=Marivibrio sp. TaxID=2039719 RepID=UPI0032EE0BAC